MTIDAFILAAGLGTRMGPLSRVLPKPAWPLRGRPLLQWAADSLRGAGFTRLACNAHHLPERLRAAADGLQVFQEPVLLGNAGGLSHILGRAADPLAVWNADALGEVPWGSLLEAHRRSNADLTWLLVPHPGGPWTRVWLDPDGRILPAGETGEGPFLFTGASLWSSLALGLLPVGPCPVAEILPRLSFHRGVVTAPFAWREIGTPGALIAAAGELAPNEEGRLPGCYVHPTARPAGRLSGCVLGPGAAPHPAVCDREALWFMDGDRQVRMGLE